MNKPVSKNDQRPSNAKINRLFVIQNSDLWPSSHATNGVMFYFVDKTAFPLMTIMPGQLMTDAWVNSLASEIQAALTKAGWYIDGTETSLCMTKELSPNCLEHSKEVPMQPEISTSRSWAIIEVAAYIIESGGMGGES